LERQTNASDNVAELGSLLEELFRLMIDKRHITMMSRMIKLCANIACAFSKSTAGEEAVTQLAD